MQFDKQLTMAAEGKVPGRATTVSQTLSIMQQKNFPVPSHGIVKHWHGIVKRWQRRLAWRGAPCCDKSHHLLSSYLHYQYWIAMMWAST
jgi:hypothetical protein